MRPSRLAPFATLILLLTTAPTWGQGGAQTAPEGFRGRLVDAGGAVPRASTADFRVHIEHYTTDDELRQYLGILLQGGTDALQKALWKVDNGYVRIGTSLGYPISITRSFTTPEGGRVVRIVTDRPIQMFEVMNGLRTEDYPFGIIELELDEKGSGQGRLIAAAKARFDESGRLEVESYGTQPFRILGVKKTKPKKR